MKELELDVARYVGRHPYKATRLNQGDPKAHRWTLAITEPPPASISIVLGDVLTNLRASLDHIAAALAPGKTSNNQFPLVRDRSEKGRKDFAKATNGMPPAAIAVLEELQPYNFPEMSAKGTPQIHPIRELSRLVNVDKHDGLIALSTSLAHAWAHGMVVGPDSTGQLMGGEIGQGWYAECHDEGHTVASFNVVAAQLPPGAEVQVHVHGTPRVSIKLMDGYGNSEILEVARIALDAVGEELFPGLEPHIPV